MKKWALVVAVLYGLLLVVLSTPVIFVAFGPEQFKKWHWFEFWSEWQPWVVIGVLTLAQWALLWLPVDVASRRPEGRRSIFVTVTAAGFALALLGAGALASVYEVVTKLEGTSLWPVVAVWLLGWGWWAFWFARRTHRQTPDAQSELVAATLLKGSILELLVAVPCHVVARHRDYCCAGLYTFIGLASGISVMLLAFGPAVYFLFAYRMEKLKGTPSSAADD